MDKKRQKRSPIIVTVCMLIYWALYFGLLITFLPGIFKIVFGILSLVFGAAIIYVCLERIKEIDRTDDEELRKY